MNILLMGHKDQFSELCSCLCQSKKHSITYLENPEVVPVEFLSQSGQYDWVIVGIGTYVKDSRRFSGEKSSRYETLPRLDAGGRVAKDSGIPSCGIKWSRDGTLQLCCGRHQALQRSRHAAQPADHAEFETYVFEFQAPCKRR